MSSETCSYCGEKGHSIQQCPKWKGREKGSQAEPLSSYMLVSPLTRLKELLSVRNFEESLKSGMEVLVDIGKFYEMAGIIGREALFNNVAIALLSAYKGDWATAETFTQKAIEHARRGVEGSTSSAVKIPPFVPSVLAEEIPTFTPAFLSAVKEAWNTKTTKTFWDWIIEPTIGGVNVTLRGAKVPHEFFPHHVVEKMVYDETRKVYVVRS